ncbi:histidine--tRNA ligase [Flavobacterium sp.]|uniref:histidine--tRNA ligase n=1 Tax=Flavobacterium sp. TaxID=239 RepID=UPI00286D8FB4|nr:histidine--tRNA ligase [Flavobacterium sp.]
MKPSIPKGTRDFSPAEVAKRQYIIQKIKTNFEKFGFQPIETPSFENSETLMGKYGEEGDRLIFKILNSGEYLEKFNDFLLKIVEESLFYHKESIVHFNNLNVEDGIKLVEDDIVKFTSDFQKIINIKNLNYFEDEKISINLIEDLYNLLIDFIHNPENGLGKDRFILMDELHLKDVSLKIFASFYLKLKSKYLASYISEKALRYDLTVPFARYVVQHQNEIEFPFKRYQIQPVWRADRPQKGRFREFFQCDADVVGSTSLWQEVELVQLYDSVFTDLGLNKVTIKINNRKILSGIAEVIGASDKLIDFTVALDKLDKIGEDGVKKEMIEKGISETAIEKVQPLFHFTGSIAEKIEKLATLLSSSVDGMKGVEELQFICDNVSSLGLSSSILDLDVTLARGLNYYTGAIFEVAPPATVSMGSIGGGGRYDDLTGIFGLKNMSGVGISFGLDRIYLVIEELNLFPETVTSTSKAIFLNFGNEETKYAMKAISNLRKSGLKVELYPDNVKIGKQFQYADKRGIPFAVIVGDEEMKNDQFSLKNLASGEQQKVSFEELKELLA